MQGQESLEERGNSETQSAEVQDPTLESQG